ncbi:RNA polymerase sigma-70 factor [Solwaraspora sp. WMMA2080]|uniref:RNA polymerase sigma-70 factor n=1 Tax=unclassified Solwaraspora TaxID=2627926 RepID=UPI00248D1534|nr:MULTISPECIES: RNA polymerase sigma-70 factor [unclassified Solwaraspora]WBB99379.1 RNA polymerase sigma-70 factor [Solwaraspora sp. WMMA2059]WBC22071.1 RNA polymerase sigma-70 factor [Solwaraspora sp. WMMA2080]
MPPTDIYDELRPWAFTIAYRMLGSVSEAEDVTQETFLRMHQSARQGEEISSPRAYAATLATRLAIDQLRSARSRRERYVGEWLPEPLVTDPTPAEQAEIADSLSLAFLVLLESLSAQQRAAFLLREVFDYPYPQVAEIVGADVDGTRHLVARARDRIRARRPRYHTTRQQRDELARRFFAAAQQGDLPALEQLLAHDVALHGDGGGKVPALPRPLHGRTRVARALAAWLPRLPDHGVRLRPASVNGQPGAAAYDAQDHLIGIVGLDIADDQVRAIHSIANPDKLRHLGPVGDSNTVVRAARRRSKGQP